MQANGEPVGILKISDQMHDNIRTASYALSRSINAQAEHWLRIGMLCELNPGLCYEEICQLLLRASHTGEDALACSAEADAAMPIKTDKGATR